MAKEIKTTPRSYTLRLSRTDSSDTRWRELLWRTHAAVNQGAKVFGDFLLTFCGGIDHRLAEQDAGKKEMGTLKDRRIILALSWLSVEDEAGAPEAKYHVSKAKDDKNDKEGKVKYETENALRSILKKRGLGSEEIKSWLDDCRNSINAAIRKDAVWVDRSLMFDELSKEWGMKKETMREEIWDFLALPVVPFPIIKQNQYMLPVLTNDKKQEEESDENDATKSPKPDKPKEMSKAALNWLSKRLGSGGGSDFEMIFGNLSRFYDWCAANRKKLEKLTGPEFQSFLAKAEN